MCSHLPGFPLAAAVPVGIGASMVAMLRLPLSAVIVATLLTSRAGVNVEPLIIVGVAVAYVTTVAIARSLGDASSEEEESQSEPEPALDPAR